MRGLIPVVVLAGYLGSGKTTLLNHLLSGGSGARIGVVVNDFGAVNVDVLLVAGDGGRGPVRTVALEGGCLCCVAEDAELDEVFAELAGRNLDVIVVEASGIAEPGALVRRVLLSTESRLTFGGLVYVVDAEAIAQTLDRHPSLAQHLALADLIVLNKIDRCGDLDAATALVRRFAPTAPLLPTTGAAVPPELLIDAEVLARRRAERDAGPRQLTLDELLRGEQSDHDCGADGHGHLHDGYRAVDVRYGDRVDPRRLAAVLEHPPAGVLRIKGFVETAGGVGFEVQTVGRQVHTRRLTRPHTAGGGVTLVFIGIDVQADGVRAAVRGTLADPLDGAGTVELGAGEELGEPGLLALLRHSR
jgi:G3E family GTPase